MMHIPCRLESGSLYALQVILVLHLITCVRALAAEGRSVLLELHHMETLVHMV